ncbi:hypothetical protein, partial [Candidatus Protofrankia californiensis]|uniref:hypothetical protein n=1 Tax=Candidatus Protofrankia californiensis TaxID=1839754 RepID=UPI0019D044D1
VPLVVPLVVVSASGRPSAFGVVDVTDLGGVSPSSLPVVLVLSLAACVGFSDGWLIIVLLVA